jgi:hypothetical protein
MLMARYGRKLQAATGATLIVLVAWPAAANAAGWSASIAAGMHGEGRAGALPGAPTGVTVVCVSATQQKVTVSWTASAHATSYAVYDSTTTAGGTYTLLASGVTATNWTSATLGAGNYWFKIVAQAGTNWASAKSSATTQSTIASGSCA